MSRLGIISDTHGRLPESVYDAFEGVDHIVHAGDICAPSVLWELESIATTTAVLGNCDRYDLGPAVNTSAVVTIGGVRVFVTHFPKDAECIARSGDYGLVIHGHTHVPRDATIGSCRIINPGSACRPRGDSKACVAVVDIEGGVVGPVRTVLL